MQAAEGGGYADPDQTRDIEPAACKFAVGVIQLFNQRPCPIVLSLSLIRKRDAACAPVEKRHAEAFLQRADALTDGGLGISGSARGRGKAADLNDGQEGLQFVKTIHPIPLKNQSYGNLANYQCF
jgi:hypothetical protein